MKLVKFEIRSEYSQVPNKWGILINWGRGWKVKNGFKLLENDGKSKNRLS